MTCARSCSGTTSLAGSFIRQAYLGLALRPGVAPPPPHVHVPPDIISVPIVDWRLDRARLLQLVTAYAPDVGVVEVEQDGSVRAVTTPPRRPEGAQIALTRARVGGHRDGRSRSRR